jgi:hypothetical protein
VPPQRLAPLVDVRRDADRPRLPGHRALNRLTDPPGGVGRELEALPPVELLDRAVQPDHAVLDQVAERHAVAAVLLGDVDDEAEVRVDHPLLRSAIAPLDALSERDFLRRGEQRVAADLVQEELERICRRGQGVSLDARVGSLELVFRVFEEGLNFWVLQGGTDGESFLDVGWTERLRRRGGKADTPLASNL